MSTQQAVKTKPDGNQIALLRVASGDGGFVVLAETAGPNGPRLDPGQLVVWQAQQFVASIATHATDKRFGWVGIILGTLKPEHRDEAWVGDKRFLS